MLIGFEHSELSLVDFEIRVLEGAARQVRDYAAEHHASQSASTLEMVDELLKKALARREQLLGAGRPQARSAEIPRAIVKVRVIVRRSAHDAV
jgi:hypothetical protein